MATTARSERSASRYEGLWEQAKEARRQANDLREMYKIATCGLDMRYSHHHKHNYEQSNYINYGMYRVPTHVALRVADSYLLWASEYEAQAELIEGEMKSMLAGVAS